MSDLLPEVLLRTASRRPGHAAIVYQKKSWTYEALAEAVRGIAHAYAGAGVEKGGRVAVFLDKQFETVTAILGAAMAGVVFVPINPALKPAQVAYILNDCNVRVLVTSKSRLAALREAISGCPDLKRVVVTDGVAGEEPLEGLALEGWTDFLADGAASKRPLHRAIDIDMVGILYTSGSTGNPKGVVLSHRNVVAGAASVAQYLGYVPNDRILNLPPYSFDFGLNQLLSSIHAGVTAVLHNFLMPSMTMKAIAKEAITGLPSVPTVLIQLAAMAWPKEAVETLRYVSTTGGRMPEPSVRSLRSSLPKTDIFLMYGLTESFRSTYLPPSEVDKRPGSIGKAIPNAEVLVVRTDGTECGPGEPGELVHRGALVSLGYWNDPKRTAERFKPAPGLPKGLTMTEMAVWSGDTVVKDEDGYIYFVGRNDEMIKTRGYRVSPTEVEEVVFASGLVKSVAAIGAEHEEWGQGIVIVAAAKSGALDKEAIAQHCRAELPYYMVPHLIVERAELPVNPNGKVDRKSLAGEFANLLKGKT